MARMTSLVRPPPFLSSTLRPTKLHARRNALDTRRRRALQAADQAGDVRAVAVVVEREPWRGSPPSVKS